MFSDFHEIGIFPYLFTVTIFKLENFDTQTTNKKTKNQIFQLKN